MTVNMGSTMDLAGSSCVTTPTNPIQFSKHEMYVGPCHKQHDVL